jgi:GR25 family glycosyltransferase involved in LPS biosynthesis
MQEIPIYITHYTPLKERRTFIQNQFDKFNISGIFILEHDQEVLKKIETDKFDPKLKRAEMSLFLKHIHILRVIVRDNLPCAHVMEDDVKMEDNYYENLTIYYKQLPENADCLFTGSGWKKCQNVPKCLIDKNPNVNVFLRTNQGIGIHSALYKMGWGIGGGSTRTCAEFIIKQNLAKKILNYFDKEKIINLPYDLWLNRVFRNVSAVVYWAHPVLGHQDAFPSSIQT